MSRRNPFEELERMFERMSRQFESEFGDVGDLPRPMAPGASGDEALRVDVEDGDGAFVVTADLPGYEKEDITIELRGDSLHVEAERSTDEETGGENEGGHYVRRERSKRSASRSVSLPGAVREEAAEATYHNGVLTVRLPKAGGDEGGRTIDIE